MRRDGHDLEVKLDQVRVGDLLLVRSGERIAVDGEIVSGSASVNQAAITGESVPVEKEKAMAPLLGALTNSAR